MRNLARQFRNGVLKSAECFYPPNGSAITDVAVDPELKLFDEADFIRWSVWAIRSTKGMGVTLVIGCESSVCTKCNFEYSWGAIWH